MARKPITGSVQRYDRVTIRKTEKTEEGFLRCRDVKIARIGVQEYTLADGTVQRDLRLPEEVFADEALSSLEGKSLTLLHPDPVASGGEVTSKNYRELTRGSLGNLRKDDSERFVVADLLIQDAEAIQAVEGGLTELSVGYRAVLHPVEGGVFRQDGHPLDGTQADVLQTKIRGNHLAIVDQGRANQGDPNRNVRIRLDSAGRQRPPWEGDMAMAMIKIGDREYDVPDEVKAYLDSMAKSLGQLKDRGEVEGGEQYSAAQVTIAQLQGELAAEKARRQDEIRRADKAEGERDAAKSELDAAKKPDGPTETDEQRADREAARFDLIQRAAKVTAKEAKDLARLTDRDIKVAIVSAKRPEVKLEGKSDEYLEAFFDSVTSEAPEAPQQTDSAARIAQAAGGPAPRKQDVDDSPLATATARYADTLYGRQPKSEAQG